MLGTYGIYTTENDMVNIFKRFDKNMDGKIHYSEFVQEMSPRANKSKYWVKQKTKNTFFLIFY